MKKAVFFGLLVMAFGMTIVGCSRSTSNGSGSRATESIPSGTLVLTNIPAEYDGKFVLLYGYEQDPGTPIFYGGEKVNLQEKTVTASRISNGKAELPIWFVNSDKNVERYTGNGTSFETEIKIFDSEIVTLSNRGGISIDSSGQYKTLYLRQGGGFSYSDQIKFSNGSASRACERVN